MKIDQPVYQPEILEEKERAEKIQQIREQIKNQGIGNDDIVDIVFNDPLMNDLKEGVGVKISSFPDDSEFLVYKRFSSTTNKWLSAGLSATRIKSITKV
jgi:hypothetical protein